MQHGVLNQIPADWVALADYEQAAQQVLSAACWAYLQGGCVRPWHAVEASAFSSYQLLPRPLRDLRGGHSQVELFGQTLPHPFLLAPVAYQKLFHPAGEQATALAAQVSQTPLLLSSLASVSLQQIRHASTAILWFQLYWQGNRERSLALLRRAEHAGHQAIVVTIDAPQMGIRDRERRAGFQLPPEVQAVNLTPYCMPELGSDQHALFDGLMAQAPTWSDIAWLVQQTHLPVLLKGILHPDDARQAIDLGIQGLIVSTHGGRVLDGVVDGLQMLPKIRAAVSTELPVLFDGGIRCGADAFKALALGATALLIGRPYIYGLATAGALGVAHVIKLLREELEVTMALCGTATVAEINLDYLVQK